ncbi:MAG: carboxypeptidase regulatory-like domain-containing protein [Acidobacteria bacterium]|nr:carboxypeptidase regulatory-like domain-containing protein [Acidobacteriota bacterium]
MFFARSVAALALFATALQAQSNEATVSGQVRDPQAAVITNVEISASNASTGQTTKARTNDAGIYSLRGLRIGTYTISVEHPGFKKYVRQNLILTTGQNLELDITLDVGAVTESVVVEANASQLETRTSDVNQLVESKSVEDMPLGDRRTMNIVQLTGAAVFINYDSGGKPNFSLAGGRTQSQNFYMDGGTIQNMRLGIGQVDTDPPVETVAEVKVLTNSYAAEYGGSAGGVIVASTKSGTNRLKGSAYEYFRNQKLDAANFFAPVVNGEKQRPPLRYNVFGVTVGGPVMLPKYKGKDRTFFFFSYEGSRRRDGLTDSFTVPLPEQKNGDFSRTFAANGNVIPIYDPATNRASGNTTARDLFPGNVIPASRIDPVGKAIADIYPAGNTAPSTITGANNYRANYVQILTRNAFLAKVDHNQGNKDRFSWRYMYNSDDLDFTSVVPVAAADTRNAAIRHQHFYYSTWTRIFSPALINEFRFTYGNRVNHATSQGLDQGWPSKLGIKGVPDDAFPQITVAGFRNMSSAAQERRQFPIQQFQVIDVISYVRGRHSYKAGLEIRPSFNYEINRPTVSGAFGFTPLGTGLPGNAASGFGLASLFTGFVQSFASTTTQELDRRTWYLAGFVQDEWNVHRDLVLNIGMRWETDTPIVDRNNRMNGFDLTRINPVSGTPGVVRFMGKDGFRTSPYDTDIMNFGPRFGFAWKPLGSTKTVIRGGFGIFYAHPFDAGAPTAANLGYSNSADLTSPDNGITPAFFLRNGVNVSLKPAELSDAFGSVRVGQAANTAVSFFEESRRAGYSQQFNFSIQRELPGNVIFDASLLGNLSRKLASANMSLNQVTPDRLTATSTQRDRPFPQFSNVSIQLPSHGMVNYYGMVLRSERRFSKGFNLLATFTWSKALNNTNEGGSVLGAEGGVYSNFYNRRPDYGPSENDINRRLSFSSVYEIPFGKGRKHITTGPASWIVGGWGLGGILTMQSGPPFTVTTQVNPVFSAAGASRANVSRNPNLPDDEKTLLRWFDTSAFSQPAAATFGNSGVGILRSDGVISADLSVLRNFPLKGEDRRVQFRGEFFNIGNHPNFGVPGRVFGAAGFGVVNSAGLGRRIQLGLRLVF